MAIANDPDATLRDIASQVGVTERAAFSIVDDLVDAGYVVRSRVGRRNHYEVRAELPLRHPMSEHASLESLLALLRRGDGGAQPPAARTMPRR